MTSLFFGCAFDVFPGSKYRRELDLIELRLSVPLPRPSTLSHKRELSPYNLVFALRAPRNAIVSTSGPLRFDDDIRKGLDWTVKAAEALRADVVIIPTPVEFATSRRERDLLTAFADRIPRDRETIWVWEPSGIWDPEKSYPFAEKLGLVCAFDPLREPPPPGNVFYARLSTLGTQTCISESIFDAVLEKLVQPHIKTVYVAFDSKRAFRQAQKLKRLARKIAFGTTF
jgi:uncharacterized protein YecE (DUF72 family)